MSFDQQLEDYVAALNWVTALTSSVHCGQLSAPTPCSDWNVRALMGHLIGTAERALGTAERRSTGHIPHVVTDVADAQLAGTYASLAARVTRAWSRLSGSDTVCAPWGECTALQAAQGFTIETVAHGWDLATATGLPSEAPPGVAERCLPLVDAVIPARLRGTMYAAAGAVAPDASATRQLASLLGREEP